MRNRRLLLILAVLGILAALALVVVVTAALTPTQTNPAFAAAVAFAESAAMGDEDAAQALMTPELAVYVAGHCPEGRVSACVQGYTPPEWGGMLSAVFRRAAPDGEHWNVDLIATYQYAEGFSGVCIFTRMVPQAGGWRVAEYAGWASCAEPGTRNMATNPGAPNRAPSAS